jgi:3-hydroxyisobutyrate dehydrogenase
MNSYTQSASLKSIFVQIWIDLGHGAIRARHPFHTPALATQGESGPDVRTVVLRAADMSKRSLICHTDLRSLKVQELRSNPAVSWLFYDRERKTQLRLKGNVNVHHDDELARKRWSKSSASSRQCYHAPRAPGSVTGSPAQETPLEAGFENFAVIECRVESIDWLYLQCEGHMRARFEWLDNQWDSHWIAP